MEKHNLQRGSVRRFRVSGTDEQNHQRAQGRRASGWMPAFPGPCPLYIVQGSQARRLPCSVRDGWADCCRTVWAVTLLYVRLLKTRRSQFAVRLQPRCTSTMYSVHYETTGLTFVSQIRRLTEYTEYMAEVDLG